MSQAANRSIEISASQIEQIVRRVLASISAEIQTAAKQPAANPAGSIPVDPVANAVTPSRMHLSVGVLSLESLRSLPKDVKEITVLANALVTPAAKDYLREKRIAWTRSSPSESSLAKSDAGGPVATTQKNSSDSSSKRLFVTGSVLWLRNLERQLCPKATLVDQLQMDDAATVRSVAQAIRGGVGSTIAIVKAPHATLWQAARDEALRPAIISQWSDLAEVLCEVPTNMLIVPSTRWNIAGTANIARKFLEHIQANR
jgi:hypothetical protein